MNKNSNCDGDHCSCRGGEVRRLPFGHVDGGAAILCYACYLHELQYRREWNKEHVGAAAFELPSWASLEIYLPAQIGSETVIVMDAITPSGRVVRKGGAS